MSDHGESQVTEKKTGEYRYRLSHSRARKVNLGGYESTDVFVSLSVGFDSPDEGFLLGEAIEHNGVSELMRTLEHRVEVELDMLERQARVLGQEPTTAAPTPPPKQPTESGSVTDGQLKALSNIIEEGDRKSMVFNATKRFTGGYKISQLSKEQATEIIAAVNAVA